MRSNMKNWGGLVPKRRSSGRIDAKPKLALHQKILRLSYKMERAAISLPSSMCMCHPLPAGILVPHEAFRTLEALKQLFALW